MINVIWQLLRAIDYAVGVTENPAIIVAHIAERSR
jgi:hypothetical protein